MLWLPRIFANRFARGAHSRSAFVLTQLRLSFSLYACAMRARGRVQISTSTSASERNEADEAHARPNVPIVYRPRTPPFHGGNTGSNPVGDARLACSIGMSGPR